MRPPDEVKLELVRQWLAKAEEDFGVAKHLIHENSPYFATVGFHAQQAAGEELKALLVWRQIEFPKTHDLDKLLDLVAVEENALAASLPHIGRTLGTDRLRRSFFLEWLRTIWYKIPYEGEAHLPREIHLRGRCHS